MTSPPSIFLKFELFLAAGWRYAILVHIGKKDCLPRLFRTRGGYVTYHWTTAAYIAPQTMPFFLVCVIFYFISSEGPWQRLATAWRQRWLLHDRFLPQIEMIDPSRAPLSPSSP